jgi:hypothetical protein
MIAWRVETSFGTLRRISPSIEYSAISAPAKALRSSSGTCTWKTALPNASTNGFEYTGWRCARAAVKAVSAALSTPSAGNDAGVSSGVTPPSAGKLVAE